MKYLKRILLITLIPLLGYGQDAIRDWTDTTLIVENLDVTGLISGQFELEFESVAEMLAFDYTNTANGSRIKCNGYNTANDGFFGPDVIWTSASTATADGLSVFNPTTPTNGRLIRALEDGINILWAGYQATTDGDETKAAANDAIWVLLKSYLDATPSTVLIPKIDGKVFYYSADNDASADCTYILEGTLKKKADVDCVGFEVPTGIDNVTLTGTGTIHGNATMTSPRAGGNAIRSTDNENFNILGRLQIYHCEGFAVNIRQPTNMTIDGLYIRNTYGSVKSGDSVSGRNGDGLHIHNPTEVIVRNCDIKSTDDALAITMLEAYTNETSGITVTSCYLEPVKADNVTGGGDGSLAQATGAGIRITQEGAETLTRLRDVTISDIYIKGGIAGMKLGTTGLTSTVKFVERLQVSNIHMVDIANPNSGAITAFADGGGGQVVVTSAAHGLSNSDLVSINGTTNYNGDFTATNVTTNTFEITDTWVSDDATGLWGSNADLDLNRSTSAGIFARGIKDAVFSNITFNNIGVNAIRVGILDNVEFNDLISVGGIIDNGNHSTTQEWERAHYVVTGTFQASDRVFLNNIRSVDSDGAGIAIVHNGGSGKEITNLHMKGLVDNPNVHGGTNVRHSAVYLENMVAGEIVEYDIDVINFTPSGNVIELERNPASVLIQTLAPLEINSWHSDIYAAAGNWMNRLQLFSPTYTVTNHFEGITNCLKIDQGTTDISGTAQAGATSSITLAAGASSINDVYIGFTISLTGGTGSPETAVISDYDGSTKVATISDTWSGATPDATTTYDILEAGGDGIYSAPLGSTLVDRHVCAEYYIHVDSGSVNIIEDSNVSVVADTITTTGQWLHIKHIYAPDQVSARIGFIAAETGTVFYLGPIKVYEL